MNKLARGVDDVTIDTQGHFIAEMWKHFIQGHVTTV